MTGKFKQYAPYAFFTLSNLLQQLIVAIKFSCKICNKAVANNYHGVQYDKCHMWVHTICNKINLQTYKFLQKSPSAWYCTKCLADIVPFGFISNEELFKGNQGSKIKFAVFTKSHTSPSQDLIDQLNEVMDDPSFSTVSTKYYELFEFFSLMNNSKNCLFLFH